MILAKMTLESEINSASRGLIQRTRNTYNVEKSSSLYDQLINDIYNDVNSLMNILEFLYNNDTTSFIDIIPFFGWLCEIYSSYSIIPNTYKKECHPDTDKIQKCMIYLKQLSLRSFSYDNNNSNNNSNNYNSNSNSNSNNVFIEKLEKALKWKCCQDPELELIRDLAKSELVLINNNSNSNSNNDNNDDVNVIKKRTIETVSEATKQNNNNNNNSNSNIRTSSSPMKSSSSSSSSSRLSIVSSPEQNMISMMISNINTNKEKRQKLKHYHNNDDIIDSNDINDIINIDNNNNNNVTSNSNSNSNEINQLDLNPIIDDIVTVFDKHYESNTNTTTTTNNTTTATTTNNNSNTNDYKQDNAINMKEIDVWGADVSSDLSKKFGLGF